MKTTVSILKADIGSVGGHLCPSRQLLQRVEGFVEESRGNLLRDCFVSHTGDDIAILATHNKGVENEEVHKLAWDAFVAGTECAREQGLYGAGQDLLKDSFSGNVKGMGPAVAEMEIEERPNEPFLFFAADKTDPGAYNLPLYLAFADPMYNSGLILAPGMAKGFKFVIMDVEHTEGDSVIELNAPEDLYDIAALLRDNERFVVEAIFSRETGEIAASVSTTRLHNIAGKYTGKDDPVMLVRCQGPFPATGEVLGALQYRPLRGRVHERQPYRSPYARPDEFRHVFLRRSSGRLRPRLLRAQRHTDRAGGRLCPSVLGLRAHAGVEEGDGAAAAGLFRLRYAPLFGAGVRRHRKKDGQACAKIRGEVKRSDRNTI